MIHEESMELLEEMNLAEGWRFQQTKHIARDNWYFTFQKFKRMFGLNHNFTREEIRHRNEERLSSLVDAANSRKELEELIEQLEQWIAAVPHITKLINSTDWDSGETKKHNHSITTDVTVLNMKYLAKAKAKLGTLREAVSLEEMTIDLRKMTYNGSVYACMKPARGETKRLYDIVVQTRPPFDPDTLRDEAHVTLVYSRKAGVDRAALDLNGMAVRYPRPTARVVGVEYWEGHDKDGYAVLKLDSPEAAALNREIQAAGAKHSFDDYQAHMTICGKVGPQTAEVSEWLRRINRFLDSQVVTLAFDRICFEDIKGD